MSVRAAVGGDGCQLTLRVEGYEFPAKTTGTDANWLTGEVELTTGTTGAFKATHRVTVLTDELKSFRDELRALDRDLTGEAHLHHLESQLGATVRLKAGKGTLAGFVREHIGAELRFDQVTTDQSYLRQALEQFDALVAAFPVRGDPSG